MPPAPSAGNPLLRLLSSRVATREGLELITEHQEEDYPAKVPRFAEFFVSTRIITRILTYLGMPRPVPSLSSARSQRPRPRPVGIDYYSHQGLTKDPPIRSSHRK